MVNRGSFFRYLSAAVIGVAVFAYVLALVLGGIPEKAHIDLSAIVLIVVTTGCVGLLFSPRWVSTLIDAVSRVKVFQFASLKLELDAIRVQQEEQTSRLELLQLLAPLVLTGPERKHLLNLYDQCTTGYQGNHQLRSELRRMRYLTLITNTKPIGSAVDGSTFDLATIVQVTMLGRRWALQLKEMNRSDPVSPESSVTADHTGSIRTQTINAALPARHEAEQGRT